MTSKTPVIFTLAPSLVLSPVAFPFAHSTPIWSLIIVLEYRLGCAFTTASFWNLSSQMFPGLPFSLCSEVEGSFLSPNSFGTIIRYLLILVSIMHSIYSHYTSYVYLFIVYFHLPSKIQATKKQRFCQFCSVTKIVPNT